jgi:phosphopantothenoylcysteine decarboxylase/phosphopantothenate--cysteine ligase
MTETVSKPLKRPEDSSLGDHDVPLAGTHLKTKRIALLATGSIASYRLPDIIRELRKYGASVQVYASTHALKYVTKDTLAWASNQPVIEELTPASEHLSGKRDNSPFDLYLVLPASYNTINKFASGRADSLVTTTLASALGHLERGQTKIAICPVMHGSMHNSILEESVASLQSRGVRLIEPRDAYGKHNIPEAHTIAHACMRYLSESALSGKKVLVTGGSTPTYIDSVRLISNKFTGALSLEIAVELARQGANVDLVLPNSVKPVELEGIFVTKVKDYDAYKEAVLRLCENHSHEYSYGVFSAAVSDYKPLNTKDFKVPSGIPEHSLSLVPTAKVIDLVRTNWPALPLVSFKFEDTITPEKLIEIAELRIQNKGHRFVVANLGKNVVSDTEHSCFLVGYNTENSAFFLKTLGPGKREVARQLVQALAQNFV